MPRRSAVAGHPEQFVAVTQDYTRRQIENFERQSRELMQLVQDGTEHVTATARAAGVIRTTC